MAINLNSVWISRAPGRPAVSVVIIATLTSAAALICLVALGRLSGHMLLVPSMAASMALIAGAPDLPLSQPRNVVGGQVLSALIGVLMGLLSHSLWAAALAGAMALGAMMAARTPHSPAAATAVIGALLVSGQAAFIAGVAVSACVLVAFGLVRARLTGAHYPAYWW